MDIEFISNTALKNTGIARLSLEFTSCRGG